MISTLDIFPTLHTALGIEIPENREYDGVNLLPYLSGDSTSVPHETLFWTGFSLKSEKPHFDDPESAEARHYRQIGGDRHGWAVRHNNWKLRYFGETDEYALFDLDKDVGESENLIELYPELADKLKNMFKEWHNQVATEESQN